MRYTFAVSNFKNNAIMEKTMRPLAVSDENRKIFLQREGRVVLMKKMNVSTSTVSDAINFRRNNKKSFMIRNYAVNKLNALYVEQ